VPVEGEPQIEANWPAPTGSVAGKAAALLLDELRLGLAEVDAAPGSDTVLARTRSLMACIEHSHDHLDPEAQALLACFARAPWKGGAFQWVQIPPGNRSSRKQPEQSWR
jgi:hypothetical protein